MGIERVTTGDLVAGFTLMFSYFTPEKWRDPNLL